MKRSSAFSTARAKGHKRTPCLHITSTRVW
jgi:hypothetical protein